jgi:hypothetical protein
MTETVDKTPPNWLAEFETRCLALSCNDPAVTEVEGVCFKHYGPRLGNALQGNTHVSFLELPMDDLVSKTLDVNTVPLLPLLNFIRQAQSLRKLRMKVWSEPEYLPYFLEAFLQNPLITDLEIFAHDRCNISLDIGRLIQSKDNLKVLRVPVASCDHLISEVLKANQTLETLALNFRDGTSHGADLILRSIGNHPRITHLELRSNYFTLDCESLYFLLASTTVLECLDIDFRIDFNFAQRFVEALHSNRTLNELHIPIGFFEDQAIQSLFVTYMQTRNGVGTSCIRTLGVSGMKVGRAGCSWHCHWPGMAQLLKGPRGSGLESVKLDELYGGRGLWAGLEASEQSRNLRSMVIDWESDYDRDREFIAMLRHLPNMLYLRKLEFYWRREDADLWKFLWAIRKNGSLHAVEHRERHRTLAPSMWAGLPSRLLHAWGQRNLELPNLLRPHDDDEDGVGAHKFARKNEASTSPSRAARRATNSALLPSLLLLARQTPRMGPSHKFAGLLAFGEYIGP